MKEKYRQAVENCEYIYPYGRIQQEDVSKYLGKPLF